MSETLRTPDKNPNSSSRALVLPILNAPAIPQLTFRHFLGESDYPHMLEVLISSEREDKIERTDTLQSFTANYDRLSNCDPYRDMIFAEVAGELVGYSRGWWSDDAGGVRSYKIVGFLVPSYRRKGIGSAMLTWTESRLRQIAAEHPAEIAKFFQVDVSQTQKGTLKMLEQAGYQPVRYFYEMVRPNLEDIPDLPLPEELELRPALPEHYRLIWKSVDETSVDEWGYTQPTEEDYQAWLKDPHFQPGLWQIAWHVETGRVAGHVLTYIDYAENEEYSRKRGYTEGIGVDRAWRRRGVARALITRSLMVQKAAGMRESALLTESENISGATRLYESCGFKMVSWNAVYRKLL